MPDVKITGKKTITGEELGASEMPSILFHKDAFGNTRQDTLDKHRQAAAGVEVINPKVFNKNALVRGSYLEHAIVPWWLEMLKEDGMECHAHEPKKAYRLKEFRLGATLDRILTVPKGFELVVNNKTLVGDGVLEVKTDFYHTNKCKPDWMVQVHQQMLCSKLPWAIVLVMTQQGKLVTYTFERDDDLCAQIIEAATEFWLLFDSERDYPKVQEPIENVFKEVTVEPKPSDNLDLVQTISDYQKASAEARSWTKTAKEAKELITLHMDGLDAQVMNVGNFQVKSVTTQKPKRTMVDVPGEFIDSTSFSVKEINDDK